MSHISDIEFITDGLRIHTKGLAGQGHLELSLMLTEPALLSEGENFLLYVVTYIMQQDAKLQPGDTLAYGYWVTKFELGDDRFLQVWEYNAEATDFVPGAMLTLTYWRDQHEICEKFGAQFSPLRPDKLAVISRGVLEGDPVQGVRYPSPNHMSGWWITTDHYDGNIKTLTNEHFYHVTAARPDLARYIALPYGFRFDLSQGEDVWFDKEVASQQP